MNKPHIYRGAGGIWYCSDGRWLGWGHVASAAYYAWKRRCSVYSCVHQRSTALQHRRISSTLDRARVLMNEWHKPT